MAEPSNKLISDLSNLSDTGVRAIVDSLSIDRENVLHVDFDQTGRILTVEVADRDAGAYVEAFVNNLKRTHKLIKRKILRQHSAKSCEISDIDAALLQSPDLQFLGDGLVGLSGHLLALFRFFEREFRAIAHEFSAEDNHYPVLVPIEVLAEVGYLDHFPQHVTFCSHLRGNLPVLTSVAHDSKQSQTTLLETLPDKIDVSRHVLTPAVCLPCYRHQKGLILKPGEIRTLTMQNHVFRYEGTNFRPLARGWDFTVRDIVFFGSYDDTVRLRQAVIDRIIELCEELDLEVTVELANDPFFLDSSRDKAIYQRMGEVKYELLFPMPHRNDSLAASSFNLHRDVYTAVYNTCRAEGGLAESACMGFGLERWLYGFLTQKGLDPRNWPTRVTNAIA